MRIQYKPQDPNHAPDRRAVVNIGEFLPGEVRGVSPDQEEEAQRLIDNGDFVLSDGEPNSNEIAEKLPKAMEKFSAAQAKRDAETAAAAAKAGPVEAKSKSK